MVLSCNISQGSCIKSIDCSTVKKTTMLLLLSLQVPWSITMYIKPMSWLGGGLQLFMNFHITKTWIFIELRHWIIHLIIKVKANIYKGCIQWKVHFHEPKNVYVHMYPSQKRTSSMDISEGRCGWLVVLYSSGLPQLDHPLVKKSSVLNVKVFFFVIVAVFRSSQDGVQLFLIHLWLC